MPLPDDFCVFILTHGRPDNVITYQTLMKGQYTGKIFIVIDDEDETADQYIAKYGAMVLMFSKGEIAATFDEGDNFSDRRCIVYARNACFALAAQVGCKHFVQLDDDYTHFEFKLIGQENTQYYVVQDLERLFANMLALYLSTPAVTIAFAQGGDYIGGASNSHVKRGYKRKAMNSFFCSVDRPFQFMGRLNEDVNFYTCEGRRGALIFTPFGCTLHQKQTQSNEGGMTDIYVAGGTYLKSFYSVMYSPSCVKITLMGQTKINRRIHHRIAWDKCAPMILHEDCKKAAA